MTVSVVITNGLPAAGGWECAHAHGTHNRRSPYGQSSNPVKNSEMIRELGTVGAEVPQRPQTPPGFVVAATDGRPAATHAAAAGSENMFWLTIRRYHRGHESHAGQG